MLAFSNECVAFRVFGTFGTAAADVDAAGIALAVGIMAAELRGTFHPGEF